MNKLSEKILENLVDEDRMCEIENEDNPIRFFFKKKDYVIHLTNIHSWTQRPHMRRVQISKSLKDSLIKYHRYYIFGIFGYDSKTDTFTNWSTNYLLGEYNKKSLYTYSEFLDKALDDGVSQHLNKEDRSLSSIHFQSKYLSKFLQNFKTQNLNLNGQEIIFQTFDHYHTKNGFEKLMKTINKHHTLSYLSNNNNNKISNKWDREEYLVTLDLYFRLQKDDYSKNMFKEKDPLVLGVYNFLKQRSQYNKTVIRSIASLSYRHANYQYIDPKISGGLDGGAKKGEPEFKKVFEEFESNKKVLSKKVEDIKNKYEIKFSQSGLVNVREYEDQDPNQERSLPVKGIDEEDIRNKQEKANSIHIKTLNILANYLRLLGLSPLEDPQTFDLFAYDKNEGNLFEVKSITQKNFRTQIRHAIIQLEEYDYKHRAMKTPGFQNPVIKNIVFDKSPYEIFVKEDIVDFYLELTNLKEINIMYIKNNSVRVFKKEK